MLPGPLHYLVPLGVAHVVNFHYHHIGLINYFYIKAVIITFYNGIIRGLKLMVTWLNFS